MTNVLLNYYNFDGEWTENKLDCYVRNKRPLIVPLAYRDTQAWDKASWLALYGKGGEKFDAVTRPFVSYGYDKYNLPWLNFYDGTDVALQQIANADLLFFTGGLPEKALQRMDELGITNAVKNFDGVVMGASAGAMLQLATYHITPDEDYDSYQLCRGLGLVKNIDLEVHYTASNVQNACARRAVTSTGMPVYAMYHEGGVIVNGNNVEVMGNVVIITDDKK